MFPYYLRKIIEIFFPLSWTMYAARSVERMRVFRGDRLVALERVMNSIRNGLGMQETEIAREPS
jgi:hypothetical protein